jgi:hypothetical protein
VVVAIDDYANRRIYTIDDSSGATIECIVNLVDPQAKATDGKDQGPAVATKSSKGQDAETSQSKNTTSLDAVVKASLGAKTLVLPEHICVADVGHILDVKGGIKVFRDQRQITIEKAVPLRSTEDEVNFWEKVQELWTSVLSVPWTLSEKEVRRCRRLAEGRDGHERLKKTKTKGAVGSEKELPLKQRSGTSGITKSKARPVKQTGLERRPRVQHADTAKAEL